MGNMMALLTDRGYLVSQQRRIILEALCRERQINDVEAFWIALREKHPVSWSTVHTTVKLLTQVGVLTPYPVGKRGQAYTLTIDLADGDP